MTAAGFLVSVIEWFGQFSSQITGLQPGIAAVIVTTLPLLAVAAYQTDWEKRLSALTQLGLPVLFLLFGFAVSIYYLYDNPLEVAIGKLIIGVIIAVSMGVFSWATNGKINKIVS